MEFILLKDIWKVEFTDDKEKLRVDGKVCGGSVHYKPRQIYIDKELPENDLRRTLMHEISHAIIYETQIEYKEFYTEENLCEFVGKYGDLVCEICRGILEEMKD